MNWYNIFRRERNQGKDGEVMMYVKERLDRKLIENLWNVSDSQEMSFCGY